MSAEKCHCGQPTHTDEFGFTRGLCEHCSAIRCDAYPGECEPSTYQSDPTEKALFDLTLDFQRLLRERNRLIAALAARDAVIEKVRRRAQEWRDEPNEWTGAPLQEVGKSILAILDQPASRPDETGAATTLIPGARCSMCGEPATRAVDWPEVNGPDLVALCDGHLAATRTVRDTTTDETGAS